MSELIIKLKRSNVPGKIPDAEVLEVGEVALNMADSLLFFKEPSGEVKPLTASNVIQLNNQTEYAPTDDYHPATKAYVDLKVLQSLITTKTIERTAILNNEITLPSSAVGDIIFNMAQIYDSIYTNVFYEVTCTLSEDKTKVLFDAEDNLDYRYCVLSYVTLA